MIKIWGKINELFALYLSKLDCAQRPNQPIDPVHLLKEWFQISEELHIFLQMQSNIPYCAKLLFSKEGHNFILDVCKEMGL